MWATVIQGLQDGRIVEQGRHDQLVAAGLDDIPAEETAGAPRSEGTT